MYRYTSMRHFGRYVGEPEMHGRGAIAFFDIGWLIGHFWHGVLNGPAMVCRGGPLIYIKMFKFDDPTPEEVVCKGTIDFWTLYRAEDLKLFIDIFNITFCNFKRLEPLELRNYEQPLINMFMPNSTRNKWFIQAGLGKILNGHVKYVCDDKFSGLISDRYSKGMRISPNKVVAFGSYVNCKVSCADCIIYTPNSIFMGECTSEEYIIGRLFHSDKTLTGEFHNWHIPGKCVFNGECYMFKQNIVLCGNFINYTPYGLINETGCTNYKLCKKTITKDDPYISIDHEAVIVIIGDCYIRVVEEMKTFVRDSFGIHRGVEGIMRYDEQIHLIKAFSVKNVMIDAYSVSQSYHDLRYGFTTYNNMSYFGFHNHHKPCGYGVMTDTSKTPEPIYEGKFEVIGGALMFQGFYYGSDVRIWRGPIESAATAEVAPTSYFVSQEVVDKFCTYMYWGALDVWNKMTGFKRRVNVISFADSALNKYLPMEFAGYIVDGRIIFGQFASATHVIYMMDGEYTICTLKNNLAVGDMSKIIKLYCPIGKIELATVEEWQNLINFVDSTIHSPKIIPMEGRPIEHPVAPDKHWNKRILKVLKKPQTTIEHEILNYRSRDNILGFAYFTAEVFEKLPSAKAIYIKPMRLDQYIVEDGYIGIFYTYNAIDMCALSKQSGRDLWLTGGMFMVKKLNSRCAIIYELID